MFYLEIWGEVLELSNSTAHVLLSQDSGWDQSTQGVQLTHLDTVKACLSWTRLSHAPWDHLLRDSLTSGLLQMQITSQLRDLDCGFCAESRMHPR